MNCRFCNTPLVHEFVDLFNSPPSNSYLSEDSLNEPESYFPLRTYVCHSCFLVQIDEYKKATEIFDNDYAYFSSYSSSWLKHSKKYVEMMIDRFPLNNNSLVVEIASNDGYLLQYFMENDIPVLGVEPTGSTAEVAIKKGIPTDQEFFGVKYANKLVDDGKNADLILGNNVMAHVPDINDFIKGVSIALKPDGITTFEFPHLLQLVENNQFDTIYHEHFSYLSFLTVSSIFEKHGLTMFDVQEIPTHGGSLRVFGKLKGNDKIKVQNSVKELIDKENEYGLSNIDYYKGFGNKVKNIKWEVLNFLLEQKKTGKKVVAYGAAAKGNTLLNYCGVKSDLIDYVVDANPHKQNKFLPGSHIPVVEEKRLKDSKPDFIIILPWNIRDEIEQQLSYTREWGSQFVVFIPQKTIF